MELIKIIVFLSAGIAISFIIPGIVQEIIRYKYAQRNKCMLVFHKSEWHKPLLIFLNGGLFALAGWKMPLPEAFLVCCFVLIAIIGSIIDSRIRIIANEMVLLLLILGIIYRAFAGGIYSFLGSLTALALVIATFGGTALINKRIMKNVGIGAGDIKLAMVIAITVGYPGVFYFLGGMAIAMGAYCAVGLMLCLLTSSSTFPMCGHIMVGLLAAVFIPYFGPYFLM